MDKQIYCVISQPYCQVGLFALWKHVASHILNAIQQGYIPVVDLQHYRNQFFKDDREYKDNIWEYYFKQPSEISITDLYDKSVKIMPSTVWADKKYEIYPIRHIPLTKEDTTRHHPYAREYARLLVFNEEMNLYFQEMQNKIFKDEKDILGVILRGTDYTERRPSGHPVQPAPEEVIEKAKELQKELGYKKIYLATEDKRIYDKFVNEFGSMLIENTQYKYETANNQYLQMIKVDRKDHFYNLNKEYAASMYLLSKCRYLIGSLCNGMQAAYFMSNCFDNYDYVYCWDKGLYPNPTAKKQEVPAKQEIPAEQEIPAKQEISAKQDVPAEQEIPAKQEISAKQEVLPFEYKNNIQKIFSVKNQISRGKKHKVITVGGIRFKIAITPPHTPGRIKGNTHT